MGEVVRYSEAFKQQVLRKLAEVRKTSPRNVSDDVS